MQQNKKTGDWVGVKDLRRRKGKHPNQRFHPGSHASTSPEPQTVIDVADSSDDASYRRRTVGSNWSRYEEETEVDFTENEQMNGADFEALQEQSRSTGTHFTFSYEKDWENDTEAEKMMKTPYFKLNLSLLNAGLQTIPFYKRLDYGESLFPKHKIKEMDQHAEKAEAVYKALLSRAEDESMKGASRDSSAKSNKGKSSVPRTPKTEQTANVADEKDDELDKLLNMTESDVGKGDVPNEIPDEPQQENVIEGGEKTEAAVIEEKGEGQEVESGNKEDIQQWLDGILDD